MVSRGYLRRSDAHRPSTETVDKRPAGGSHARVRPPGLAAGGHRRRRRQRREHPGDPLAAPDHSPDRSRQLTRDPAKPAAIDRRRRLQGELQKLHQDRQPQGWALARPTTPAARRHARDRPPRIEPTARAGCARARRTAVRPWSSRPSRPPSTPETLTSNRPPGAAYGRGLCAGQLRSVRPCCSSALRIVVIVCGPIPCSASSSASL